MVRIQKLSASKLELAAHCLYFAREDLDLPYEPPGLPAREGLGFHDVAATVINAGGPEKVTRTKVTKAIAAAAREHDVDEGGVQRRVDGWLEQWSAVAPAEARAEVVYIYDPLSGTVRTAARKAYRTWRKHPREIVAIVDVDGTTDDGVAEIHDHKTGFNRGPDACEARQLAVAALCVSKARGAERVRVSFDYVDEGGQIDLDQAELDSLDLAGLEGELREMAETTDPEPRPGTHCAEFYCPALPICPHWRREVQTLVPQECLSLTLATAADAYDQLKVAQKLLKSYEEQIKQLAREAGGLRLNNGKLYREVEREAHRLDTRRLKAEHPEIYEEYAPLKPYKTFESVKAAG